MMRMYDRNTIARTTTAKLTGALTGVLATGLVGMTLLSACQSRTQSSAIVTDTTSGVAQARAFAADANRAFAAKDYTRAADLNRKAIALDSSMGWAWNNLGIALLEQKEYLGAADALKKAAELLQNDPRPLENLGLTHATAGYDSESLKYYALSLEKDPYWLPSLRGALLAQKRMLLSDEDGLDRVKRGLYTEKDPTWRKVFEVERMRIEQELAERKRSNSRG